MTLPKDERSLESCPFCGTVPERINMSEIETKCAGDCPCADLRCLETAWNTRSAQPIGEEMVDEVAWAIACVENSAPNWGWFSPNEYGVFIRQARAAIAALKGASHGEGMERLRNMIASYFDNEDAEYTPDEIRAGSADHCIVKALALTPSEQGSGLREALEEDTRHAQG